MKLKLNKTIYGILGLLVIGILIIYIFPIKPNHDMEREREKFLNLEYDIQKSLLKQGKYRCCLEKPCHTCVSLTPYHGEGATCSCLEDIVNGVNPCGECTGGILSGRGNPLLAEYFAKAIAEETGEYETIKLIIEEKYDIPIEEQL